MFSRSDVVQTFLDLYEQPSYLEVGVCEAETFNKVVAAIKVAVDPHFQCPAISRIENGQDIRFFEMTSDKYFGEVDQEPVKFDVIYLDGLHTFEQTFRDLLNAISRLKPLGVIVIDDVIPNSYHASLPDLNQFQIVWQQSGSADLSWMGDVYKLVFLVNSTLQQFSYATIKENHGQLVVWPQRRSESALGNMKIEQIGRLEYLDVLAKKDVFKITPLIQIEQAVKANICKSLARPDHLDALDAAKAPKDFLRAPANEERAHSANWTAALDAPDGRKSIADGAKYNLAPMSCPNRELFAPAALDTLVANEERQHASAAPISMYAFENTTLLPHGGIIVNGKAIDETFTVLSGDYLTCAMNCFRSIQAGGLNTVKIAEDRPVLIVEQPGIFNYGHWLIEMYPKIFPLIDWIKKGHVKLGLPVEHAKSRFLLETLSYMGVAQSAICWLERPIQIKKVLYLSPISMVLPPSYVSPWSIDVLTRLATPVKGSSRKKIFISRKDATIRYLLNEDDVYAELKPLGYEYIRTGDISFEDQISLFKGAEIIVGVYGASLSNIVFCEPGATVWNLCPNNVFDPFFWNLASLRGLNYNVLAGEILPNGDKSQHFDFHIDLQSFEKILERL